MNHSPSNWILALLGLVVLELPLVAHGKDEVELHWKRKTYALDELPEAVGATVPQTVALWGAWVSEHDYRMDLSTDARVLVISHRKNAAIARQLKLIDKTAKLVDKLLPVPERIQPKVAEPEKKPVDEEIPEDPEGGPAGWDESDKEENTWAYEWGSGTFELDTETCILFVARNMEDYGSILDLLATQHEYLQAWLPTGKRLTGFVLERPLAAAYVEYVSGQEEWDPKNELVNRVTQMLYLRRFSQLPYWLVQGLAWHVEYELLDGLYCFPYRSEFVFATEHTGWPTELKRRYRDKKPSAVEMDEFATWQRGKFLADEAKASFGLVSFLAKHGDKGALSSFSEALRAGWEAGNRVEHGDGTWTRNPDYSVPPDEQRSLLQEHYGEDVLSEAARYLVVGKKYRRKK